MNKFYVYEWYNVDNGYIFYVGKGCNNRYKTTYKRNKIFKQYLDENKCDSRIIRYFDNEIDAFRFEHLRIIQLKKIKMCCANIDNGGIGGVHFVWNKEMREYKSKFNPMKSKEQKDRMSKNNPMKNKNIAKLVSLKNSKIVVYNNEEMTTSEMVKRYNIHIATAQKWAKRGYDTNGNSCHYKNENPAYVFKMTNSKEIFIDDMKFNSLKEGAKFLGVKDTSPLCKALKNNTLYHGHICRYANQQPSKANSDKSSFEGSETNG